MNKLYLENDKKIPIDIIKFKKIINNKLNKKNTDIINSIILKYNLKNNKEINLSLIKKIIYELI